MDIELINILIPIIGIVIAILIVVIPSLYKANRKMNALYEITWKKSSKLKLNELLGIRGDPKHGFHKYYLQREEDKLIQKKIEDNKNILIIGNPLAGKSRAMYHSLIAFKKPYDVIVPKLVDISLEDFRIPFRFSFWRKRVIVFDDLNKFADKQNFLHLLQEFIKINTIIIASCRSGPEYEKLFVKIEKDRPIFDNTIKIPKVSGDQGTEIAQQVGINMPERFDGNIGSLFINLDAMKDRYKKCGHIEKGILRSIKRLYYGGIYREREIFSITKIKYLCNIKEEIDKKNYEWIELLKGLQTNGFIIKNQKDDIWIEEVYIDFVVEEEISRLDNFNDLMDIFVKDPEVLYKLGNKAYDTAEVSVQKKEYVLIAIKSFKKALKIRTLDRFPMDYAMTQNYLGNVYRALAEVKDKEQNCQLAIKACQEALKIRTLDPFPMQYAMTQNNLGVAHRTLAEVKDKDQNSRLAINACQEALRFYTPDHFPMQYAETQNSLKVVQRTLAEVEDNTEN
jgi:tetratricopeptide (TPR) repeat protein